MPISRDARLELVATATTHTEGPALGPDGLIYFCDLTVTAQSGMEAGAVYAFDPRTSRTRVVLAPSGMASGIKFDAAGDMLMAEGADYGSRAIVRVDHVTRRAYFLATQYQQRRFNSPNDLTLDRNGRIYFTDPRYFGGEPLEQAVSGVYRLDTDGSVHLATASMSKPNGIAISPDGRTMYVSNNDNGIVDRGRQEQAQPTPGPMQIVAFDLAPDGSLSGRRVLVDLGPGGGADGIAVDAEGDIWATVQGKVRPGVRVYSPAGKELASLASPEVPYNLALVEDRSGRWLYVTAGRSLYRTRLAAIAGGAATRR